MERSELYTKLFWRNQIDILLAKPDKKDLAFYVYLQCNLHLQKCRHAAPNRCLITRCVELASFQFHSRMPMQYKNMYYISTSLIIHRLNILNSIDGNWLFISRTLKHETIPIATFLTHIGEITRGVIIPHQRRRWLWNHKEDYTHYVAHTIAPIRFLTSKLQSLNMLHRALKQQQKCISISYVYLCVRHNVSALLFSVR